MNPATDIKAITRFADRIRGPKLNIKEAKPGKLSKISGAPRQLPFSLPEFKRPDAYPLPKELTPSYPYMNKEPAIANLYRGKFVDEKDMAEKRILEEGEEVEPWIGDKGEAFAKEYLKSVKYDLKKFGERLKSNVVRQPEAKKLMPKAIRAKPVKAQSEYISDKIDDTPRPYPKEIHDVLDKVDQIEDTTHKAITSTRIEKIKKIREDARRKREEVTEAKKEMDRLKQTKEGKTRLKWAKKWVNDNLPTVPVNDGQSVVSDTATNATPPPGRPEQFEEIHEFEEMVMDMAKKAGQNERLSSEIFLKAKELGILGKQANSRTTYKALIGKIAGTLEDFVASTPRKTPSKKTPSKTPHKTPKSTPQKGR